MTRRLIDAELLKRILHISGRPKDDRSQCIDLATLAEKIDAVAEITDLTMNWVTCEEQQKEGERK